MRRPGQRRCSRQLEGSFGRLGERVARCGRVGDVSSVLRRELLILERANARRQSEQTDEAGGISLLVYIVLTKRDEAFVVERVVALTPHDGDSAFVEAKRHGARNPL